MTRATAQTLHIAIVSMPTEQGFWTKATTDPVAAFTLALAVLTALLVLTGIAQWNKIGDQIKLARDEFNASHRPRLRLHRVISPTWIVGERATVQLEFFNIGETDAKIASIGVDLFLRQKDSEEAPVYDARPGPFEQVLPPGQMMTANVVGKLPFDLNGPADIHYKRAQLCLALVVNYLDGNGVMRTLSSFRVYNPDKRRFFKPDEDDELGEIEYEG